MRNLIAVIVFSIIFSASQADPLYAGPREYEEYEVKAAFLGNFLKFIDWPKRERDAGNYRVCIYGSDPFGDHAGIIDGTKIKGRTIQIKRPGSLRSLGECNLVFIASSERRRINSILESLRDLDIVTVGDTEGYAKQGVMFNFYIEARKVKFEINLASIKRSRINVSSQLLKLGRIVDHE